MYISHPLTQAEEPAEHLQDPRPEGQGDRPGGVPARVGEGHDGVDGGGADRHLALGAQQGVHEAGGDRGVEAVL